MNVAIASPNGASSTQPDRRDLIGMTAPVHRSRWVILHRVLVFLHAGSVALFALALGLVLLLGVIGLVGVGHWPHYKDCAQMELLIGGPKSHGFGVFTLSMFFVLAAVVLGLLTTPILGVWSLLALAFRWKRHYDRWLVVRVVLALLVFWFFRLRPAASVMDWYLD